jgi:MtN3 and saliva related transmembrane protein
MTSIGEIELLTNAVGFTAAIVGTSMMLPQVARLIRTKKATDLSLGMTIGYSANCILWLTYGCLRKDIPMELANAIGFGIAMTQLTLKIRHTHNSPPDALR